MRTAKFQQLSEGAIFLFESRLFTTTVIAYDHRVANQTVIASWGAAADEDYEETKPRSDDDYRQVTGVPDWRAYPTLPYAD